MTRVVGWIIFVVALVAAIAVPIAGGNTRFFPAHWDPRVAPIAAEVEKLRGLQFTHAVPVKFLEPAAFEKLLSHDPSDPSGDDRASIERDAAILRSIGLLSGKVDLEKATNTATQSGALAFYSYQQKAVFVRGTTIDAAHRVTLAHELTHVLQDEHFDLTKLEARAADSETGDATAYRALVEGDAVNVEDKYREQMSSSDQAAYERQQDAEGKRVQNESADVPAVVELVFSAPYELGPSTIQLLESTGGTSAIDAALTGAVPDSRLYVRPADLAPPDAVATPEIPAAARADGPPESFGPFETYLALAMRLDAPRALLAADVVTGGRAVAYRSGTQRCYRVSLTASTATRRQFLRGALADWAKVWPAVTVDTGNGGVGFTACDPGKFAAGPADARFQAASQLLGDRTGFTVGIAKASISPALARCIARVFMQEPAVVQVLPAADRNQLSPEQEDLFKQVALLSRTACERTLDAGLP
jgi:hypothetical protein